MLLKSVPTSPPPQSADILSVPEASTVLALVRSAQRGDMRAFERLYRLHSARVMGLCMRMVRERDAAEDCVQQTFIKAWRNLDRFEARSAFSTWLHGIAVNVVLTQKRMDKGFMFVDDPEYPGHAQFDESDAASIESRADAAIDTGDLMDIEQALATLPDGARYVVVLQGIYGYSHEEVADMLGIAVGTCKAQLHRARRMLRTRLTDEERQ